MRALPLVLLLLATGCGDAARLDGDAGPRDASADDVGEGIDAVTWAPCPLYVDRPDGPQAECTTVSVPLRWSEPDGPTLGIFVQRLRASAPARAQLWMLNGGPGGSGADFDELLETLHDLAPTIDLYAIDHRGTGRSGRLSCPEQESDESESGFYLTADETADCYAAERAEWGEDLAEFTTTAAARDLGRLIERTAVPDQDVFVYGVSYGTYWAHRYLQVHPDQASAVVLDSIAPPTQNFAIYDRTYDAVGQDFMALCGADAVCSAKLGPDPWAAVEALFAAVATGHCAELVDAWGLDRTSLRTLLGTLLTDPSTRTYLPSVVYRMSRCAPGDVTALEHLLTTFFGTAAELSYYDTLGSDSLFYNVTRSELWPNEEPDRAAIEAEALTLHVGTGLTSEIAASTWPAYPDDVFVGRFAETDVPLLMMNGDLDPQTPLAVAQVMAEHFNAPHQRFVRVPRAAHAVVVRTPVAEGDRSCGLELMLSFLADPTGALDQGCLDEIPAESFVGDPALHEVVLGTDDLWENAE